MRFVLFFHLFLSFTMERPSPQILPTGPVRASESVRSPRRQHGGPERLRDRSSHPRGSPPVSLWSAFGRGWPQEDTFLAAHGVRNHRMDGGQCPVGRQRVIIPRESLTFTLYRMPSYCLPTSRPGKR